MRIRRTSPACAAIALLLTSLGPPAFAQDCRPEILSMIGARFMDVEVVGDLAVVSDLTGRLLTIDVSDPVNPAVVGAVAFPFQRAPAVAVRSDIALVAAHRSGLQIVDVSDRHNPLRIGEVVGARSELVAVDPANEGLAFVGFETALSIFDIREPANPETMATVPTGSRTRAIVADDGRLFVGADPFRLRPDAFRIFDVQDPANPAVVGAISASDGVVDLAVRDDLVFAAARDLGLLVIDVADSESPVVVGSIETVGEARLVAASDDIAFVMESDGDQRTDDFLRIVDVTDPTSPTIIGSVQLSGHVSALKVGPPASQRLFVAASHGGNIGLRVIDISSCVGCPADLDGDGVVGTTDLELLLSLWSSAADPIGDLNGDGVVGAADLGLLLGMWGACQA